MKQLIGRFQRVKGPKTVRFVGKLNGFEVELRQITSVIYGPDPDQFELWQDIQDRPSSATVHDTQHHLLPGGSLLVVPARAYWRKDVPAVAPFFPQVDLPTAPLKQKRGRK